MLDADLGLVGTFGLALDQFKHHYSVMLTPPCFTGISVVAFGFFFFFFSMLSLRHAFGRTISYDGRLLHEAQRSGVFRFWMSCEQLLPSAQWLSPAPSELIPLFLVDGLLWAEWRLCHILFIYLNNGFNDTSLFQIGFRTKNPDS